MKKYFVPHESNDYRPHILRPRMVTFMVIVALVVESAFLFGSSYLAPHSKLFGIIVANTLVDETNAARTTGDLPALQVSPLLTAAAQDKANDMVANNYFAHTSPTGITPWYWFGQVGYSFTYAGENLAVNFADSQDVTDAWLASTEHRANILDVNYTQIGIATAQGTYQGAPAVYVVELFGTPAAAPIAFINQAAAAANAAALATPTASSTPAPAPPVTKPAPAKPVVKPAPVASVPAIVAPGSTTATSSGQTSIVVAVKGAETSSIPAVSANTSAPALQSNFVQTVAANPRSLVDYLYYLIVILFGAALIINVLVKIRIQHPQLIIGGALVILIAGLCIVLNQHFGLSAATIL